MSEIREFQIEVADEVLDDLKQRLSMTRWPNKETPEDWSCLLYTSPSPRD